MSCSSRKCFHPSVAVTFILCYARKLQRQGLRYVISIAKFLRLLLSLYCHAMMSSRVMANIFYDTSDHWSDGCMLCMEVAKSYIVNAWAINSGRGKDSQSTDMGCGWSRAPPCYYYRGAVGALLVCKHHHKEANLRWRLEMAPWTERACWFWYS